MRVLLLNPPAVGGIRYVREGRCEQRVSSFQYNMLPISLLTTAALLRREGHTVWVVDAIARDMGLQELLAELRAGPAPGLVLLNVSTATFSGDAAVASALCEALPNTRVAAFGVHVTALPEESLREAPALDAVIRREPEVTAAALVAALETGGRLGKVAGISWRDGETIISNDDRPFLENLDTLPLPARDLVDHALYPAPVDGRPHTLVITSRGCPYPCTFCTAHLYYGSRLRRREPTRVVDEIEEAVREQRLGLFTFWSDTFTLDRGHVIGICDEMINRGLKVEWMANSRVDRVDEALLRRMREAGCTTVSFGVESGSQAILDRVRKGTRIDQIEAAFDACRNVGMRSAAHIILGLPGETPDTIRTTLRLVRRIRPDFVQFYGAVPFPGTDFHREAATEGWITARVWGDYEINRCVVSTPSLSADELERWRRRAYLTTYLSPRYLVDRLADVKGPRDFALLARAGVGFLRDWVLPRR